MTDSWSVTQAGQIARITTALGADKAFLEGFTFTETLGDPFRLTCDILCGSRLLFGEHRGTGVSIEIESDLSEGAELQNRTFHGVLTEASMTGAMEGEYSYRLTARPWFWVLSLGRDCRIFSKKTARQIITDVFTAAGVATSQYDMSGLSDRGTIVREYCVQYEESDFAFLSRLMEEEGIYYYFAHTATAHTMHLCDSPGAHTAFDKGQLIVSAGFESIETPHLTTLNSHVRPSVASYAMRDQHWKLFGDMRDASDALDGMSGQIAPKIFEYPGGFSYLTDGGDTDGAPFAKMRLEAENAENLVFTGEGTTFAVPTGASVEIVLDGNTASLLVVGATHRLTGQKPLGQDAPRPDLSVEIETINVEKHFRPPRLTPKPFARGPQVATVVGKSGEEIDVDDAGRVRVQFPWDRSGRTNELCSCWIRVSSSWAGPSMGESFLPRIGQEVLVTYIDGDMDRPVITGRLHDSTNVVWAGEGGALPALKTESGWKTQTVYGKSTEEYDGAVDPPTDEPGFNIVAFEDRAKQEKVFIRAQRDFWLTVFRDWKSRIHRDRLEKVGRDAFLEVETGNETHKVTKGKRTTTINQDETLTVEGGNMATTVQTGNQTTKISKGDQSTEVSMGKQETIIKMGDQTTDVQLGNISIKADLGKIDIEALQSITLKVGNSSIVVDQMGVTIKGMMIKTEAILLHDTKAVLTQVNADAILILKGSLTMIN